MPHIHNEPGQHDHTASAYIIRTDQLNGLTPKILVHLHKKFNRLLQPGGHVELNETPWEAIEHELLEEAGYEFSQLQILQPNVTRVLHMENRNTKLHPYPFCHNTHQVTDEHSHTDIGYLFTTNDLPKNAVGEGESQDLRWLTEEELRTSTEVTSGVRDIGLVAFDIIKHQHDWIPVPTSRFS
jgi:8-oxo-dGTP diphosphatase